MNIGIDMGGTNMRAALIDGNRILCKKTASCPSAGSQQEVLDVLVQLVRGVKTPEVTAIGAGIPSVMDRKEGIVYNVANIPSWKEVPLKACLEDAFHVPVSLDNDSNCFALGLAHFGEGRNYNNFLGVTLGTGLGAGVVIDKQLYRGCNDGAGELGSLSYKDSDIEHYCSSHYFLNKCECTARDVGRAARQGDKMAKEVWNEFGIHIGRFIKTVMFTYDTEAVIFGGGIASGFDLFEKFMWKEIASFPYAKLAERLKVFPTGLNDAALFGAASLCESM